MQIPTKKVWYVALLGRPNSWKSTFINTLIDEKVSSVSSKPQTTRKTIKWIYNDEDSQIIFFDTPWLNESREDFSLKLKKNILDSLENADVILRFIDSSRQKWNEDEIIDKIFNDVKKPKIIAYTKSDIRKIDIPAWSLMISSIKNEWLEDLINEIKKNLKTWPLYYDEDYYTDQDYETRISEIIQEKIFLNFEDEIPHSTFVEIGEIDDTPQILRIQAYIYVDSDSQKIILIWKNGQALSNIGKLAREELQNIYSRKIFLALRIKVMPKWKKNKKLLDKIY